MHISPLTSVLFFIIKKHTFCGDHVEENLAKPGHKPDTNLKKKKKFFQILGFFVQPIFKNMAIWKSLFSQIW